MLFLIQPMVYIKNNIGKNKKVFVDTLLFNVLSLGLICIYLNTIPYVFAGYMGYDRFFCVVLMGMVCIPVFYIVSFVGAVMVGMVVAVDKPWFSLTDLYKVILLVNCLPFFCVALFLCTADLFQEKILFRLSFSSLSFLLESLVLRFYYYALVEYISVRKVTASLIVLITLFVYVGGFLCGIIG